MGKKLRNFLVGLVAALGLVVLAFSSQTTTKAATQYGTNDLLTGMSIEQKNYGTGGDINLTLDWSSKGLENDLVNGDTWKIDLPDTIKVREDGEQFPLYDDNGDALGTATLKVD